MDRLFSKSPATAAASTPKPIIYSPTGNNYGSVPWYQNSAVLLNIILILLFLAILGINLLSVAGDAFHAVAVVIGPTVLNILQTVVSSIGEVLKIIVLTLSNGLVFAIQVLTGATVSGINLIEGGGTGTNVGYMKTFPSTAPPQQQDKPVQFSAASWFGTPATKKQEGKSGWCLIGQQNGYKSCVQVGENDTCQSNLIFPSRDMCINPYTRV